MAALARLRPSRSSLLPWGVLLGVWGATAGPLLLSGSRWGIWDWDHHFAFAEMERHIARGKKTIAALACELGCCTSTVKRVRALLRHASPETLQRLRAGKVSIGSAWQVRRRMRA